MRRIYSKLPSDTPRYLKIMAALFDNQGQIKMGELKKYLIANDPKDFTDPNVCEKFIRFSATNGKLRIDEDTTVRINVDGFNELKDYFLEIAPEEDELHESETVKVIIENMSIPKLSKLASKIHRKKIQYSIDIENMITCIGELDRLLDKYGLTTDPLVDNDNDLGVEKKELMDTASMRLELNKWKAKIPQMLKLAFKLQLRQYGDDKVLTTVLNEIYKYEKWQMSQSVNKKID